MIEKIVIMICLSMTLLASNYQNMSDEEMQSMMKAAQKMKVCMKDISAKEMAALKARVHKFETEVNALCMQKRLKVAQSRAVQFGKDMKQDATIQKIMQCSEVMPKLTFIDEYNVCP